MPSAAVQLPDLQPVILGGDIGAYSLARTFHEAYGTRSVVVSTVSTGLVRHSRILTNVVEPGIDDADTAVARLRAIAAQHVGRRLILLGSADWLVRTIVENRDRLEDLYVIPYTTRDRLDLVTDKDHFGRLCAELGLAHPTTVVHDVAAGGVPDTSGLTFPVIAKTANTAAYHQVEFPGKRKVFTVATPQELAELLERIRASGYTDSFVIQDFIPGDDSGMRILTCYSDARGRMRFASFGHVLLEEHTPGALGNPAGIITQPGPEVVEQARRLLEHIGWTGYANFDLKYDPRDGRTVFFELNPRLGRSNFYITAAGRNTAELYVREHLQGLDPLPDDTPEVLTEEHLYTVLPRPLLLRYVADRTLRARARHLFRRRHATNPLWYRAELDPRRVAYLLVAQLNQFRKYRTHYPLVGSSTRSVVPR
ncbi:carboxylate--amine ligase [Actinotalea sp. K2]|uniref:carboxylate--amine ligase n=1 Tax=Actinotalea sp. K2 TaxID=2939438 RepID=UPI0020179F85|nr:carboxylate--amine ligase [Actinotalea sp. K2]MCL3862226.1 carboxylate--amine ligase [Actinotalea sp. K2]